GRQHLVLVEEVEARRPVGVPRRPHLRRHPLVFEHVFDPNAGNRHFPGDTPTVDRARPRRPWGHRPPTSPRPQFAARGWPAPQFRRRRRVGLTARLARPRAGASPDQLAHSPSAARRLAWRPLAEEPACAISPGWPVGPPPSWPCSPPPHSSLLRPAPRRTARRTAGPGR